ncbi:MAG: hypothetical protein ACTSXH_16290 [Promethearchaeota archaeon]
MFKIFDVEQFCAMGTITYVDKRRLIFGRLGGKKPVSFFETFNGFFSEKEVSNYNDIINKFNEGWDVLGSSERKVFSPLDMHDIFSAIQNSDAKRLADAISCMSPEAVEVLPEYLIFHVAFLDRIIKEVKNYNRKTDSDLYLGPANDIQFHDFRKGTVITVQVSDENIQFI